MADNYLTGKTGFVSIAFGGGTINPTTGVLAGGITGAASNGGPGLVRLTLTSTTGLTTGMTVTVAGVVGTTEANGTWVITVISATTLDLVGSVFANAYVSGGTIRQTFSFEAWNLGLKCNLPNITNFTSGGFQALLSGIISGDLSVNGPYNNSNMGFTAGNSYVWVLGFTSSIVINVPAIISAITIDDKVSDSPRISISAQSSGVFLAAIV